MEKEEYAIVLEYLPHGYPLEGKMMPIAQAIGEKNLTLLELVPRRGMNLEIGEKVYIGEGKRDKIYYIIGRLKKDNITETAKIQLKSFITKTVGEEILSLGVHVMTSGNHIWDKKEALSYIPKENRLLRPANYPDGVPGSGNIVLNTSSGEKIAVLNISGRVFMNSQIKLLILLNNSNIHAGKKYMKLIVNLRLRTYQ